MEIKQVYCLFEQSGTFKHAFQALGYQAIDIDIENSFNETDIVCDIFDEIDAACNEKSSFFDKITKKDLILAFFPCTYFSPQSQLQFMSSYRLYVGLSNVEICERIIARDTKRSQYYQHLLRLIKICFARQFQMIIENPGNGTNYLICGQNFIKKPDLIDYNRRERGDKFVKPTAYWFFNCQRTYGHSDAKCKQKKTVLGTTGFNRSTIEYDYAVNFIRDFILGKEQSRQLTIF
jgi:hypothetical protein